ncbi:MAG: pantetheine-phosphate adenylyltransferase [Flammeovirgaceae bacterium]|nr:pantetheine-phosphate adenylyltransferase [Flammeovirgaceae bacterium]
MKKIALFPGSFDPFTKGHADVVRRGRKIFDEIIISIGFNQNKHKREFDIDLMIQKIEDAFSDDPGIKVITYNELTAHLAQKYKAHFLLRGLRNTTDFEYENSIAQINSHIFENLETVFLITSPEYAYISSSIVREIYKYGQNIEDFIPYKL